MPTKDVYVLFNYKIKKEIEKSEVSKISLKEIEKTILENKADATRVIINDLHN